MSRSYRAPWYVDGYKSRGRKKYAKREANHKVRRIQDIPDGKAYKKFFCSWNISDYRYLYNPEPYISWGVGVVKLIEPEPIWRVNRK
jgi:hypothetical protein